MTALAYRPIQLLLPLAALLVGPAAPVFGQEAPSDPDERPADGRVAIHGTSLDAPPAVADLLDPFRGDPDSTEVARVLAEQGQNAAFPATPLDEVLVARLWRRAGETGLGTEVLEALPSAETGSLALLERARLLLETDANRAAGTRAYWAACERVPPTAIVDFRYDLLAVSTPEERERWAAAGSELDDCSWLRDFWSERAQRMAISTDERVALHYRRLAHARDWYWIPRPRYAESWADKRGRADGLAIDDRGLMYVRMGPPETDEGFIGLGSEGVAVQYQVADFNLSTPGLLTGVPDDELDETRCWPYPRPDGYRIFCFSQLSASGYSRADGDYKLQQTIFAEPGTQFYHRYVKNSNLGTKSTSGSDGAHILPRSLGAGPRPRRDSQLP